MRPCTGMGAFPHQHPYWNWGLIPGGGCHVGTCTRMKKPRLGWGSGTGIGVPRWHLYWEGTQHQAGGSRNGTSTEGEVGGPTLVPVPGKGWGRPGGPLTRRVFHNPVQEDPGPPLLSQWHPELSLLTCTQRRPPWGSCAGPQPCFTHQDPCPGDPLSYWGDPCLPAPHRPPHPLLHPGTLAIQAP